MTWVVRINVLEPAVERLMQVVQVVLASATSRVGCCSSLAHGHSYMPSIVHADTLQQIAMIIFQSIGQELGPCMDVEVRVLAVASWGTSTFVLCDLHESLLATTTDSCRVARTLLQGDRSQEYGRQLILICVLVEQSDKLCTSLERAARLADSARQVSGNNVVDGNSWRTPASIIDTTV